MDILIFQPLIYHLGIVLGVIALTITITTLFLIRGKLKIMDIFLFLAVLGLTIKNVLVVLFPLPPYWLDLATSSIDILSILCILIFAIIQRKIILGMILNPYKKTRSLNYSLGDEKVRKRK